MANYMMSGTRKAILTASIEESERVLSVLGYKEDHGIWESPDFHEVFFLAFPDSKHFSYEN